MTRLLLSRKVCWPVHNLLLTSVLILVVSLGSPAQVALADTDGRGYCPSIGGSTTFERIDDVTYEVLDDGERIAFVVDIYITNAPGCQSGEPCDEYEDSPEYVNAWVDWNGDERWTPAEKVLNKNLSGYENINYQGILTARSEVPLPLNRVSQPMMRVNLGWDHDPRVCDPSWERGDVHDMPIVIKDWAVTRLTATNGHAIREVPGNVIWDQAFDTDCELIVNIGGSGLDYADYPFARRRFRTANLQTQVSVCPEGGSPPTVSCWWSVTPTSHPGFTMNSFVTPREGWTVNTPVRTPNRVGIYDVAMRFTIRSPHSQITNTTITRKMFVPYKNPIPAEYQDGLALDNRRHWYDTACDWAAGQRTGWGALRSLRSGTYDFGSANWIYGYLLDEVNFYRTCDWIDLVDPGNQDCPWWPYGDCYDHTAVLHSLVKVLGVGTFTEVTVRGAYRGFVTIPGSVSIDPTFIGNVRPETADYDRYQFKEHRLLKRGTRLQDATFDARYNSPSDFILWDLEERLIGDTWPTVQGPVLENVLPTVHDHWMSWEFTPETMLAEETISSDDDGRMTSTGNLLLDNIIAIYSVDDDNNGIAEGLAADASMTILNGGDYRVAGLLTESGHVVSVGPRRNIQVMTGYTFEADSAGSDTAHFEFSGEDIWEHGQDGSYRIHLYAFDASGVSDSISTTHSVSHEDFGEVMARVTSSSDGLFSSIRQGADSLRMTLDVSARAAVTVGVEGEVFAQDTVSIATAWKGVSLSPGSQQVILDFSGTDIEESELDGPYEVGISLVDSTGVIIASREHTTDPYDWTDFAHSPITPTGTHTDSPLDPDGNGLYKWLRVCLEVDVEEAVSSILTGWLTEPDSGSVISMAADSVDLVVGTQDVCLLFRGTDISGAGIDGPYTLASVEATDTGLDYLDDMELGYSTAAYQADEFQEGLPEITYLGDFTVDFIDTDTDGLGDFLDVSIALETERDAYLLADGDLYDSSGRLIVNGYGELLLSGRPSGYLPIRFDGRYIFGSQENGPYEIRNVFVYHNADVPSGIFIESLGETPFFDNEDFEFAGVIMGIVESAPRVRAQGAEVRSYEYIDYTDENGEYQLFFDSDTTTTVRAIYGDITEWSVVLNGHYIHRADSMVVNVVVGEVNELVFSQLDPADAVDIDSRGTLEDGLHQNVPNPFSPSTQIAYVIPSGDEAVPVKLRIYDPAGRLVRSLVNGNQRPGVYRVQWDGLNEIGQPVNAGVYFYRLELDGRTETRRMILVR